MNPGISIVIPIYNMAKSLDACIQSILNQKNENFELVLVDDGSVDNSYDICCDYANRYSNIIAIHQENQGSGPARNAGINAANGEYLLFIDSDDLLKENALHTLCARIEETHSDLYVFGYDIIFANIDEAKPKRFQDRIVTGTEIRKDYAPYYNPRFPWAIQGAPWNKLFRTKIVKENHVTFPPLRRHQDEIFISRFVSYVESVRFTNDALYIHTANDARSAARKVPKTYFEIAEKVYEYRKEIIIPWNPENETVKALIYSEYINNSLRACSRLLYKEDMVKRADRRKWYKQNLFDRFVFEKHKFPKALLGQKKILQNKAFLFFVKHRMSGMLELLVRMRMRIFIGF